MELKVGNAKILLTEAVSKNFSANEITEKAKTSLSNVREKAINSVTETIERAKTSFTELETQAVHNVTATTTQAINSVNETAEQAKLSLETNLDKLETMSGASTEAIQRAIASSINTWLNSHSIIHWLVNHPLIALGIVLVSIFLILSLFQAIITVVLQAGLFLLKSPFTFGQFLVSRTTKSSSNTAKQQIISLAPSEVSLDKIDTLESLITRLEELNQEQNSILQEIAKIIKHKN